MKVYAALGTVLAISLVVILTLATPSAAEWPPYADKLSSSLLGDPSIQAALEELEAKLLISSYDSVTQTGIVNVPRFGDGHDVVGQIDSDPLSRISIRDDPEWEELFQITGVWGVRRREDAVSFFPPGPVQVGEREIEYGVVHGAVGRYGSVSSTLPPECDLSHRQIECGTCVVQLADHWHIRYQWRPASFFERESDGGSNGLSLDEELERASDRYGACVRAGIAEMANGSVPSS